jgi:phage baseplate assembly protein V
VIREAVWSLLRPELSKIRQRLSGLILRGFVQLVQADAATQRLQVGALPGETLDDVEHWQPYGFGAVPLPGAAALLLAVGATRSHTICALVADGRHRPTGLEPGDSYLHDNRGQLVRLSENGVLVSTDEALKIGAANDAPILLEKFKAVLDGWTPVPNDGGAALKTALTAAFEIPGSLESEKLKTE